MTTRTIATLTFLLLPFGTGFGQQVAAQPHFAESEVHASPKGANSRVIARLDKSGRYEIRSATMLNLLTTAYGFDGNHIVGGAGWIEKDLFDVVAKGPAGTDETTLKPMLKTLLTERFELSVHPDTKAMSGYVLRVGRKPLLKSGDSSGDTGCTAEVSGPGQGRSFRDMVSGAMVQVGPDGTVGYVCRNTTLAEFAEAIRRIPGLNLGDVQDQTGIKGIWSFKIRWSPAEARLSGTGAASISFFDAIDRQLGLKLQREPVPTAVLVIDHVSEFPTPDSSSSAGRPGQEPVPAKFDLATIKLHDRERGGLPRFEIQPGGRFVAEGLTLTNLVARALYDGSGYPVTGVPLWAGSELFDVVAQMPRASTLLDTESIGPMLHSLLVERFKLTTHIEERPISIYQMIAVHPKLKKADPANRSHCGNGEATPGTPPALSITITCRNTTMAEFAARLRALASPAVNLPVDDDTGLEGAWDFTLSFSSPRMLRSGSALAAGTPDGIAASDPNEAISVFDALQKQLGLKLEPRKRPGRVVVVDHLEKMPTDN